MAEPIQIKVCGLTSEADAAEAVKLGASFIGFILHPASPRYIALDEAAAIARRFAGVLRVAVSVEPEISALEAQVAAGFDRFQIHYRNDLPIERIAAWSTVTGRERLWLVPKLPPEAELSSEVFALADTVLFDTYQPKGGYGGSGKTSNWEQFVRLAKAYPSTRWILAGGLNPANVAEALQATGARILDLNSGGEASPGKKDPAKLAAFFKAARLAGK